MKHPFVIWIAVLLHVAWGWNLIHAPDVPQKSTAVAEILAAFSAVGSGQQMAGVIFLTVGLLAGLALCGLESKLLDAVATRWPWLSHYRRLAQVVLLMPQQLVMVLSAVGAAQVIGNAHYADGVARPREFIFNDQIVVILMAAFHTVAILEFIFYKPPPVKLPLLPWPVESLVGPHTDDS